MDVSIKTGVFNFFAKRRYSCGSFNHLSVQSETVTISGEGLAVRKPVKGHSGHIAIVSPIKFNRQTFPRYRMARRMCSAVVDPSGESFLSWRTPVLGQQSWRKRVRPRTTGDQVAPHGGERLKKYRTALRQAVSKKRKIRAWR